MMSLRSHLILALKMFHWEHLITNICNQNVGFSFFLFWVFEGGGKVDWELVFNGISGISRTRSIP